ncbi:MAG: hypothetical protein ACJ73L_11665 [Actinomycetes bacterium]
MTILKWTSRVAVVLTTAISVWRLWKAWRMRSEPDVAALAPTGS